MIDGMRAAIGVLAGALLFVCGGVAHAQDSGPNALDWTPVDDCPTANAHGQRVFNDVATGAPNAPQELRQLANALKQCARAQQRDVARAASGEVIPDDGPVDPGSNRIDPAETNGPDGSVLAALQTVEQLSTQYQDGSVAMSGSPDDASGGPSFSGQSNGAGSSSGASSANPPYAHGAPSYAQGTPSYAQPASAPPPYAHVYAAPPSYAVQPVYLAPPYAYYRPAPVTIRIIYARAQARRLAAIRRQAALRRESW